jgi:hypothetical protein
MNRPFCQNLSYLDVAKSGIENFFEWFGKSGSGKDRDNKYMLLTYGAFPHCIKSNFNQSPKHLLNELKMLKAHDLSTAGQAFSTLFDFLNAYRYTNELETIGQVFSYFLHQGSYIGTMEDTFIFWFTDGGLFFHSDGPDLISNTVRTISPG